MTQRQESLKEEIISISDNLQLGIYQNDSDWFHKFMNRMSKTKLIDSYSEINGWVKIARSTNLSLDFIREFENRLNVRLNWLHNKKKLPLTEILPMINSEYIVTWDWDLLNKIAQSDDLTDDIVRQYEKLFDQTCEDRSRNAGPGGSDFTAWHFISINKNISEHMRMYANSKMKYNPKPKIESDNDVYRKVRSGLRKLFAHAYIKNFI